MERLKNSKLNKGKLFLAITQLLLLLLCGIWAISGNDQEVLHTSDRGTLEQISLSKGTYHTYITYTSESENNAVTFISVGEDSKFLADTLQLYPWESSDYLQMWVLKDLDDITFACDDSYGAVQILDVSIVRTREWKRMLWVCLLACFIGIDSISCLVQYIRKQKEDRVGIVVRTLLLVGAVMLASSNLRIDRLLAAHDEVFHLSRIEFLKDALLSGQFPVRIQSSWFEGAGYAVSVFYGDLLLYVPAFLRIMGFPLQTSFKMFMFCVNLGTALVAVYSFGKVSRNKWLTALAAVVYTLSVYRLGDIYVRQAVGEYSALIFFPLVICGFYRIFYQKETDRKKLWIMPSIGMMGIITSHCISSLTIFLLLVVWCVLNVRKMVHTEVIRNLVKTVVATVGMSLWFLVPLVDYLKSGSYAVNVPLLKENVNIQEAGLDVRSLFGTIFEGLDCRVYGWLIFLLVLVSCFVWGVSVWIERRKSSAAGGDIEQKRTSQYGAMNRYGEVNRCGEAALLVWFGLSIAVSTCYFPWDALSHQSKGIAAIANTIQFPYRFAGGSICIALLFLLVVWNRLEEAIQNRTVESRRILQAASVIIFLMTASISSFMAWSYLQNNLNGSPRYELWDSAGLGLYITHGFLSTNNVGMGEYIPSGTDTDEYKWQQVHAEEGVLLEEYQRNALQVAMTVKNTTEAEKLIGVPLLYYKGYKAYGNDGLSMKVIDGENHRVTVAVPAGYYGDVRIRFVEPWYWRIAELITLLSIIGVALQWGQKRNAK